MATAANYGVVELVWFGVPNVFQRSEKGYLREKESQGLPSFDGCLHPPHFLA